MTTAAAAAPEDEPNEEPQGHRPFLPYNAVDVRHAVAAYPDETQGAILWLLGFGRDSRHSTAKLGELLDRDGSVVSRLFRGTYKAADLAPITKAIWKLRDRVQGQETVADGDFCETPTTRKIWKLCELARKHRRIACLWGESQVGKSTALQRFQMLNNHGRVRMVEMPSGGAPSVFQDELARVCLVRNRDKSAKQRGRIFEALKGTELLIIDEVSNCQIGARYASNTINTLNFIREIWNRTRIGMVLCATNVFRDDLERGTYSKLLAQLLRRSCAELQLPDYPPAVDVNAIAKHWGLPRMDEATKAIVQRVVRTRGLTKFTMLLTMGRDIAAGKNQTLDWSHWLEAHDAVAKLRDNSNQD